MFLVKVPASARGKMHGENSNWRKLAIIVEMLLCRGEAEKGNDGRDAEEKETKEREWTR